MSNRQFEVPFNHTEELLQFLEKNNKKLLRYVKHILVAPYYLDYVSTRHKEAKKPLSRQDYERQVQRLQNAGYTISLLFNMPETVETTIIEYYIKLDISTFIVNNDELAKTLKQLGLITIASITKRLQLNDIKNRDLSMYDYIVLDYTFNASLNRIKQLPPTHKYILMVNTFCDYTCDFYTHWRELPGWKCPRVQNQDRNVTVIDPHHYDKFDDYISIYKLEGREYTTKMILEDIMYWVFIRNKYRHENINTDNPEYYYRYKGE